MEQRGVLLRGIARVLNAGGSALLNFYDAASSIKTIVLPGEKGTLRSRLREYERKIERLYFEIGKEVALRADTSEDRTNLSAAAKTGVRRVTEHQAEIDNIRQRLQEIEAEEKAAAAAKKEAAQELVAAGVKTMPERTAQQAADTEESHMTELPKDSSASMAAATEETIAVAVEEAATPTPEQASDAPEPAEPEAEAPTDNKSDESAVILVEAAETPEQEPPKEMAESDAPFASATLTAAETEAAATVELETLTKNDLLQICSEKGIEADKRMTKSEIIELISRR
ncbi:MAG TPA: Rho termination factor N-terminal domain-containing protein [Syntrophales bacterium]|nr:Rho termination factor N-terminal domain-containing protein [Syntrophales bacterium]